MSCAASSLPTSRLRGVKSLMVMQMVHRNNCRSLGQRTSEPQVMQRPVAKSVLPTDAPFRWPRIGGGLPLTLNPGSSPSAPESDSESSAPGTGSAFFFLLEKSDGNGWLTERMWRGREGWLRGWRSSSDELESPWRWWFCMWSQTSISETREVLLYRLPVLPVGPLYVW